MDGQELIKNQRTGVPRATLFDLESLSILFPIIYLALYQKVREESFRLCDVIREDSSPHFDCESKIREAKRTRNIWLYGTQFGFGDSRKISTEVTHTYANLFPRIYSAKSTLDNIIRLHDPFSSSTSFLSELIRGSYSKNSFARSLRTKAFLKCLRDHPRLVAQSEVTKERFLEIYRLEHDQIHVNPLSVGFNERRFRIPRIGINKTRAPYILCVMSQRQGKDPAYVINEWAKVYNKIKLKLIVVGSGFSHLISDRALSLRVSGKLITVQDITRSDLEEIQSGAKLSIFASSREGFGLPIAEALYFGSPILHNNSQVLSEVSGNLLPSFTLGVPDELGELLEFICTSEDRLYGFREKSYERGSLYTHEASAERWKSILRT